MKIKNIKERRTNMEEWKTIEEYPEYEISTYGRVRSKDRDCIDSWNRHYYLKGKLIKYSIS